METGSKVNIVYCPQINNFEKDIFEKIFGKGIVNFSQYVIKGGTASYDVRFIIEADAMSDFAASSLALSVKQIFSQPKRIELMVKHGKSTIVVSNAHKDKKILLNFLNYDTKQMHSDDFSEDKFRKLFK